MFGIIGFGAYVPKWRIAAKEIRAVWPMAAKVPGVETKAVADFDEDVITMGVNAAERAFFMAGVSPEQVEAVYFASASAPFEEKSSAALIQTVMGIPSAAVPFDISHSTRAGSIALRACLNQVESQQIALGLVIAADNRLAPAGDMLEYSLGAGAVAFLIGSQGVIAQFQGWSSVTNEFTNSWRPNGERFIRRHDDSRAEKEISYQRTVVEAGQSVLGRCGLSGQDIKHLAVSEPDGTCIQKIAKSLGMTSESSTMANIAPIIGNTGVASPLLGLVRVLCKGNLGEKCLVISFGSGCGSDSCIVELTGNLSVKLPGAVDIDQVISGGRFLSYPAYAKRVGIIPVASALPDPISGFTNQPNMLREAENILGLSAQKCKKCGSINFPHRDYCIDCRGQEFEKVKLPRRGTLVTYNIQHIVAIGPEEGPIVVGTAKLDGAEGVRGGKVSAAMIDCDTSTVNIGMPIELVFRRCGIELGIPKYGYKFQQVVQTEVSERGVSSGS